MEWTGNPFAAYDDDDDMNYNNSFYIFLLMIK